MHSVLRAGISSLLISARPIIHNDSFSLPDRAVAEKHIHLFVIFFFQVHSDPLFFGVCVWKLRKSSKRTPFVEFGSVYWNIELLG